MISPVSFGSTFKVLTGSNYPTKQQIGYDALKKYCDTRWLPYNEKSQYDVKQQYGLSTFRISSTIVAPKTEDKNIEQLCKNGGVYFTKLDTAEIMKPAPIVERVDKAPQDYTMALINAAKLEKILENQEDNNFKETKADYLDNHKKETQFMLKSGDKIPASTLHITTWYPPEDVLPQIKQTGKVDENSIVFNFEQQSSEVPDHCMYFAMQQAGLKNIPVYLDAESYKAADALGIIKKQ